MDSQSACGRKLGARLAPVVRRQSDGVADGGVETEAADFAAQRNGAMHRAAVGIERHGDAAQVVALPENLKDARGIGGDGAFS